MDYTTFNEAMEQMQLPEEMDALSVYRAMEQVQDGRYKRGVRYSIALILTLILLGKLAGMTTPLAIAEWVRLRAGWLRTVLPTTRQTFPCAATYSNVLRAVDAEQVNAVLTQALIRVRATARCGDEPSRLVGQAEREEHVHVALDGKTLRGTLGHEQADQKKMHQLGLYETQTGLLHLRATLARPLCADRQGQPGHLARRLAALFQRAACRLPRLAHGSHRGQRAWAPGNPRDRGQH